MTDALDGFRVKQALTKALARLGTTNGHALPESHGNADPILHEVFVAYEGASYFDKRKKSAMKELQDSGMIDDADKVTAGNSAMLLNDVHYTLTLDVANPSNRLDAKKLRTELIKQGIDSGLIDQCIAKATTANAAPKKFRVSPNV